MGARRCRALDNAGAPDDFVVMIHGTSDDAEALWDEVTTVIEPMGLRLLAEKTRVCHIDEGFDLLG